MTLKITEYKLITENSEIKFMLLIFCTFQFGGKSENNNGQFS